MQNHNLAADFWRDNDRIMRAQHIEDDLVNANRIARIRERHSANGRLQDIGHTTEAEPTGITGKLRELFPHEENLEVNGREVRGFVVPHWAAGVILAAFLGAVGVLYSQINSQRDMIIEMRTEMRMTKEFEAERSRQLKEQADVNKVYIDNMTGKLTRLEGLLTQQQLRRIQREQ